MVPTLSSRWDKEQDKGLVLIGVTDEEPAVVEEWLAKMKPTYPIAITRGAFENQIKVPHFPYSAVIGPDGNIAYAGNAGGGEKCLDEALAKSTKQPLWPKSLSKVAKLMRGEPVKAYAELRKMTDGAKVPEADKPVADSFLAYLEDESKAALDKAREKKEKGLVLEAVRAIEGYAAAAPPFPSTAECASLLKELQAAPDFKKEVAGGELYLEAARLEKEKEFLEAFELYKSAAKKFAGTRIAENARAQAERIRTDGMAGFEKSCEGCFAAKRACGKHKKDVKL
jgi:hypothetical protein